MAASTKSSSTRAQLFNLMSQHTATAQNNTARPVPVRNIAPAYAKTSDPAVSAIPSRSPVASVRYTVRLLPTEVEKVNDLTLEAHQRLGERITVSDVIRIALMRVGATMPIVAEDVAKLRSIDRRRCRPSAKATGQEIKAPK